MIQVRFNKREWVAEISGDQGELAKVVERLDQTRVSKKTIEQFNQGEKVLATLNVGRSVIKNAELLGFTVVAVTLAK